MTKFTHPRDAKTGHKWQLRDGTPVAEVKAFNDVRFGYSIVGVCNGQLLTFTNIGERYFNITDTDPSDLIDVPVERTVWMNIYGRPSLTTLLFPTKEEADDRATISRVARVKVTYTEGQFDE